MSPHPREVQHLEPAWRDRSDFVIAADLGDWAPAGREQLWARRVADDQFEVCCIPFFLDDVALGDVVETETSGPRRYVVGRVVRPSGRSVFRAHFPRAMWGNRNDVTAHLAEAGALLEWSSASLLAVDARDDVHAQ